MYNPATRTDHELVYDYLNGNELSFYELVKRHKKKLRLFIGKKIKDKEVAKDITSDIWLKAVCVIKNGEYKPKSNFENWIVNIAHHCIIDYYRRVSRVTVLHGHESELELVVMEDSNNNREENIIQDERCAQLRSLLRKLPRPQHKLLLLYFYSGKSGKEISEMLHISLNTLNHRFRYALQHLKTVAMSSSTTIGYE